MTYFQPNEPYNLLIGPISSQLGLGVNAVDYLLADIDIPNFLISRHIISAYLELRCNSIQNSNVLTNFTLPSDIVASSDGGITYGLKGIHVINFMLTPGVTTRYGYYSIIGDFDVSHELQSVVNTPGTKFNVQWAQSLAWKDFLYINELQIIVHVTYV